MKFIHFSDTHIGVDTIGPMDPETRINGRVLDYLDMLDSIIDFAEDEKVDIALFTGDAFHHHTPNLVYLNEFSKRVARLSKICPTVLLVGNHDMARLDKASSIEVYNSLSLENVYVGNSYNLIRVKTKHGIAQIGLLPYPTKHVLKDFGKGLTVDETNLKIKEFIGNKAKELGDMIEDDGPAFLMGHFSVMSSQFGAERGYIMSESSMALEDLADPVWDYVALGHIHMHQNLTEGIKDVPPVVYAGSTERVSFNEEKEEKGFVFGEIIGRKLKWEFVVLDTRPYKTIEVTELHGDPTVKVLKKIEKMKLQGAVIRLIIKCSMENQYIVNLGTIEDALKAAKIYCISSIAVKPFADGTIVKENRSSILSVSMTTMEMLKAYLDNMDKDDKEIKAISRLAKEIMNGEES